MYRQDLVRLLTRVFGEAKWRHMSFCVLEPLNGFSMRIIPNAVLLSLDVNALPSGFEALLFLSARPSLPFVSFLNYDTPRCVSCCLSQTPAALSSPKLRGNLRNEEVSLLAPVARC